MLMFFDIRQNPGLFTEFIKTAEGSFKGLVVTDFNAGQAITPPFGLFELLSILLMLVGRYCGFYIMSMG
jgi:hypothetical protein